ncbi:MAG: DUF4922 domain-containing protein [Muribaculaceae bacterium]|nr:DUF4922 domain-containing protein [Muribaculaceae bacterium]
MNTEEINDFVETQLAVWPEARRNFDALAKVERKRLQLGELEVYAQHNPGRIVSTAAKTDAESIKKRACFLCSQNRPKSQIALEISPEWDLLLNPFPILPIHFTIADRNHRPQDGIPAEMALMAQDSPDLAIFYNGARAGASAPDHRHCQAVLKSELPIIKLAERYHNLTDCPAIVGSTYFDIDLPFHFVSACITPDDNGVRTLRTILNVKGVDAETGNPDAALVNVFFWMDDTGLMRSIVIPRKAHRPKCFFKEGYEKMTVSPGALDMAGLLILPVEKDFNAMTSEIAREIYSEVAFADRLPDEIL